ncbi:MFS transporter [Streptomyces caeni]|uniref:MFS transporter n=1 Tax=Streptomyces caeni TaxID=2307231 RepID=A0ABW4ISL7_9ACTN
MSAHERTEPTAVAEAPSAAGGRHGLALLIIATAQCMLTLDGTIMNVALPSVQRALHLAVADLNWVITIYALTFGGLLLVGGRAGDVFGRRKVFRIGLVVFAVASLIGGLATSGSALIAARALQGIGAAIIAPTALSLLATTFPPGPARNKAFGVYGAMGALGSVLGLLLGGSLTEYLSWRWVLFVNVPIAIAVLMGTSSLVEGERQRVKVDLPGAIAATAALGSLVYAINRAASEGWGDRLTVGFLAVAAVLMIAFVLIQRASAAPMIPSRVLKERGRVGSNLIMFLAGACMFATFYFLTLYMQVVKGYSPMQTGLAYLPFALGIGIAAGGIGPQLLSRVSERTVIVLGLLLATVGMGWFSVLTPQSNLFAALLPAQLVVSVGLGLTFVTTTMIGVRGVAPEDTGIASGLLNTSQQVGGAVGLAVLATIASTVTSNAAKGGAPTAADLTDGYTVGFVVGGGFYLAALIVGSLTIRAAVQRQH